MDLLKFVSSFKSYVPGAVRIACRTRLITNYSFCEETRRFFRSYFMNFMSFEKLLV